LLGALYISRDRGYYYYGRGYGGRNDFFPWYAGYGFGRAYSPFYSYYAYSFGRNNRGWHNNFNRFDHSDWRRFTRHRYDRDGDWRNRDWENDRRRRGDRDRDQFRLVRSSDDWREQARRGGDDGRRYRDLSDRDRERISQRTEATRQFQ